MNMAEEKTEMVEIEPLTREAVEELHNWLMAREIPKLMENTVMALGGALGYGGGEDVPAMVSLGPAAGVPPIKRCGGTHRLGDRPCPGCPDCPHNPRLPGGTPRTDLMAEEKQVEKLERIREAAEPLFAEAIAQGLNAPFALRPEEWGRTYADKLEAALEESS
jgi:hypothetical protein